LHLLQFCPTGPALLTFLGACLGPVSLAAQSAALSQTTVTSIDEVVTKLMAEQHVPGVALAVVRAGRLALAKGYGFANLEHQIPVAPETVFKIGSVSKQFIATGIMVLAQDGKLSVDDPIAKHVPGAPASWSAITLRHFLTHTSGVIREGPAFNPLKVQPDSVVVASAFGAPLQFTTGTRWQYCNVCYFTLADIIRRTSGQSWPEFMTERVFKPAGMTDTRTTTTTELVPRRASGYVWREERYAPAPDYLALRPSGAFLSTVLDLAKWDSVLAAEGGGILTRATRSAMATAANFTDGSKATVGQGGGGYGFGWMIDALDGHDRVQHGGALPGFRAQMSRYPKDQLTIIVLTNGDGAQPGRIEEAVARVVMK
jgi:CubicO group peptidase (beta-lactamase class C family)